MYDKTKVGLIYAKPGNQCKARTRDEVAAAAAVKTSDGVKSGLSHQEAMNRPEGYGLLEDIL